MSTSTCKGYLQVAHERAVIKVNAEKLQFNWLLGRDLVRKKAEERWGSGVVKQLSLDLRREFPDADGFSVSNLWYMKKWYCFYTQKEAVQKLQRAVGELERAKFMQKIVNNFTEKLPDLQSKLNFYVNAVDELLKAPEDNPTIGLLICSNMDSTDAFEGTVGRAHAPSAKGNAYYETAHSEKRRIARSWRARRCG